ncbi:hypothetical protein MMC10_004004 [Thelotrema lepadinum]|nr:hypothetical protein [Thelotrema lepadinum]
MTVLFFVPETYSPVLLREKARKLRTQTEDERWYASIEKMDRSVLMTVLRSLYRPFILLIFEPMCLNLCILSAILLGIQYLFLGVFGVIFANHHGFLHWEIGLTFSGITVGMVLAVATGPLWRRNYNRLMKSHEQRHGSVDDPQPEYHLPPAVIGAPLVTLGLFWFAWTIFSSIHWIVPIIGSAFFGAGMVLVFSGVFTFLVDAYPLWAASALGANSFVRSTFAAAFPLFGVAMFDKLGYNWATSLLAFLSLIMAPFPYIFYKYGKRIRRKSKFATSK